MCYFLFGAVNSEVNSNELNKINSLYDFCFKKAELTELIKDINSNTDNFRITKNMCDCESKIGGGKTKSNELDDYSNFIMDLSELKNIKNIFIGKVWANTIVENNNVVITHLSDIKNLNEFLANLQPNTIYKIHLYKKFY